MSFFTLRTFTCGTTLLILYAILNGFYWLTGILTLQIIPLTAHRTGRNVGVGEAVGNLLNRLNFTLFILQVVP